MISIAFVLVIFSLSLHNKEQGPDDGICEGDDRHYKGARLFALRDVFFTVASYNGKELIGWWHTEKCSRPATISNFSNGRGDKAVTAHYNLDISDSEWIFEMSKPQNLIPQFQYFGTKIYGKNPMTSGPYTGLCRTFRIQVTRRALAQNGSQSLYPWSLGIVNGFAKASSGKVAGSFF